MNKSAAIMEAVINKAFRKKSWNKYTCFYYHGGKFFIGRFDIETGYTKSYEIESRHLPEGDYHPINFQAWQNDHEEYLQEKEFEEYLASKMQENKKKEYELPKEVQKELDLYCEKWSKKSEEEKACCGEEEEDSLPEQIKKLQEEVEKLRKQNNRLRGISANQHDTEYGMLDVMAKLEQKLQAFEDKLTSMEGSIRNLSNQQFRFENKMNTENLNLYSALQNTESDLVSIMEKTSRRGKKVRELHENLRAARTSVAEL
jgi:DNA repair exonuclease SbcCD ATPase subunit